VHGTGRRGFFLGAQGWEALNRRAAKRAFQEKGRALIGPARAGYIGRSSLSGRTDTKAPGDWVTLYMVLYAFHFPFDLRQTFR